MPERYQNFVGGAWTDSASGEIAISTNPADISDVIGEFQASNAADADSAVTTASAAKKAGAAHLL